MTSAFRDLLNKALELPLDERAELAAELLQRLHDAGEEIEAAWAAEIQSRVAAARAGELESTDWRKVLERATRFDRI